MAGTHHTSIRGNLQRLCSVFVLLLACAHPGLASIRQSDDKIVDQTVETIVETMPFVGLGLPSRLKSVNECYVIITARATYTDIKMLASPEVAAPRVATALSDALRSTPYVMDTVFWSADDYAAAHVLDAHGHLGARFRSSIVPIRALVSGIRAAGLVPHVLLRVPKYAAVTGLPAPTYNTKNFRWYGEGQLHASGSIGVSARLNPIVIAAVLAIPATTIIIGLACLLIAVRISKSNRDIFERRKQFGTVTSIPFGVGCVGVLASAVVITKLNAVADLWLGQPTTINLFGIVMASSLAAGLAFMLLGSYLRIKLLGKPEPAFQKITLDPEEEVIHKKMRMWYAIPHATTGIAFAVALLLIPRTSPYYPYLHPLTTLAPLIIGALIAALYRKPLAKFTKKTVDPDLTWFARDIGKQLGFHVQDVFVVESSRAVQVAEISMEAGGTIIVTQKFKEVMTPEEAGFLLSSLMIERRSPARANLTLLTVLLIVMGITSFVVMVILHLLGSSSFASLSSRLFPFWIGSIVTIASISIFSVHRTQKATVDKAIAADLQALALNNSVTIAQTAVAKMMAYSAYRDPINATRGSNPGFTYPSRLAALQRQAGYGDQNAEQLLQSVRARMT